MTGRAVSAEQRALLETVLHSFEKLELVHVVRMAERPLTMAELGVACRFEPRVVASVLAELEQAHLIELDGRRDTVMLGAAAREQVCESLMAIYQADRTLVLTELSSIVVERIRRMTAKAFADAFIVRKKRED